MTTNIIRKNIKGIELIIVLIIGSINCYGQNQDDCEPLYFSDSLLIAKSSKYCLMRYQDNKEVLIGDNSVDINTIFVIEDDCFKIKIIDGCCKTEWKFVTNGIIYQDSEAQNFYLVNFHFVDLTHCKGMCRRTLSFDISKLKNKDVPYLKFMGFDQLIKYPKKDNKDSIYIYDFFGRANDSAGIDFLIWEKSNAHKKIALTEFEVDRLKDIFSKCKIKKTGFKVCSDNKVFRFMIDDKQYDMLYSRDWFYNLTQYDKNYYWIRKEKDKNWIVDLINKKLINK